jgi:hypothetical protein
VAQGVLFPVVNLSERFHNFRALPGFAEGGIYFHPSDEDLSLGTPDRKMPLGSRGSRV